jgi:hypothetical protein
MRGSALALGAAALGLVGCAGYLQTTDQEGRAGPITRLLVARPAPGPMNPEVTAWDVATGDQVYQQFEQARQEPLAAEEEQGHAAAPAPQP